jgi:hypothetical protein
MGQDTCWMRSLRGIIDHKQTQRHPTDTQNVPRPICQELLVIAQECPTPALRSLDDMTRKICEVRGEQKIKLFAPATSLPAVTANSSCDSSAWRKECL